MRFKKEIIIALLLLCILMSGAVSATSDTNDTVSSDVTDKLTDKTSINDNIQEETSLIKTTNYDTNNQISTNNKNNDEIDGEKQESDETTNSDELLSNSENTNKENYYFNSSSDHDGEGTIENPYNKLDSNLFKTNSNLYFANGIYNLDLYNYNANEVTLIGEDAEKTIIKYDGYYFANLFNVNSGYSLHIYNLTLIDIYINIQGSDFEANNVIFKDTTAIPTKTTSNGEAVNSAFNSFGGVIYAHGGTSNIRLNNCTFINNTGEYGGSIYIDNGNLEINQTKFINNSAFNYGGAIAGIKSNISINNTLFINDISTNDAGGAIYLYRSPLTSTNVNITNCSSTFGGAITSLESDISLIKFNAKGNTAKYSGGAIYQMYKTLSIENSIFTNNTANNGGAIYVDDLTNFKMDTLSFTNNTAENYGGAIYALLIKNSDLLNIEYKDNKALINDTLYQTDSILTIITDRNYNSYFNDIDFDGVIPESYDLRDFNLVTPVKDQGRGGNCWAFASIAALESAILKASGTILDLSEENMKNIMAKYSDYGKLFEDPNTGGDWNGALGYLTSWLGPIYDSDDLYDDYSVLSPILDSITHIQNVIFLNRNDYLDNNNIKEAIMKYGAVATTMRYDFAEEFYNNNTKSYYYNGPCYDINDILLTNHAVTIIGWDDNYSKDNFNNTPIGDGAWIVKNSWGENWGDNGYFYVSYYDTLFAKINEFDASYVFVLNDTNDYNKIYQYDLGISGFASVQGINNFWLKNVFNATDDELLVGVSIYFNKTTNWTLFINVSNEMVLTQNGQSIAGYVTIPLNEKILLKKGNTFEIMFKITDDSKNIPFAISPYTPYTTGISFYGTNGRDWNDSYDYFKQILPIKAFTTSILRELSLTSNIDSVEYGSTVTVTARLTPGATGQVTFKLNDETSIGETEEIDPETYTATHTFTLTQLGENRIYAYYNGMNSYETSSNSTVVTVNKIIPDLFLTPSETLIEPLSPITVTATLTQNALGQVRFVMETQEIINDVDPETHTATATFQPKSPIFGEVTIYAYFTGISQYNNTYNTTTIKAQYITSLTINELPILFIGEENIITGNLLTNTGSITGGRIILYINGEATTITNRTYGRGNYTLHYIATDNTPKVISVKYEGNTINRPSVSGEKLPTNKIRTNVSISSKDTFDVDEENLINGTVLDTLGAPVMGKTVTLYVNREATTITNTTDGNGKYTLHYTPTTIGAETIQVKVSGDDYYIENVSGEKSIKNRVKATITYLVLNDIEGKVAIEIRVTDSNDEDKIVKLNLTGNLTDTIKTNRVYINKDITPGNYEITLTYDGEEYSITPALMKFTVTADPNDHIEELNETINNQTCIINNQTELIQELKDTINKLNQTIKDQNANITQLNNTIQTQKTKINTLTQNTSNNKPYQSETPNINPQNNISPTKVTKIIAKNKTFKTKLKVKKYTIKLKNKNKVIKKATVKLTIKSKKYKVKTNNKGKATFKITNLKKKGKYTAIITYNGIKKTVKIIVK